MTDQETKTRTITLTDRRPVKISEDEWKVIAEATGDSVRDNDVGRHRQAIHRGEADTYTLKVRQHSDGRTIVYGILDAAIAAWHAPAGGETRRGGELLSPPDGATIKPDEWYVWDGLAQAIRRVGEYCELPPSVIRECISDLPAQEL